MKKREIIIIAYSITNASSMSGGDKNFIENARWWLKWGKEIIVVTTPEGKMMCQRAKLKTKFILLPTINVSQFGIFITYLYRMIYGSFFLRKAVKNKAILYSSSDLLTDILPPLLVKLKYPQSFWAVSLNLLSPHPFKGYEKAYIPGYKIPRPNDIVNFLSQKISFLLIKKYADKIIPVNGHIKNCLLDKGFPQKRVITIGRGMDLEEIKKIPEPKNKNYEGVFLGRFHPQKGLFDLVEIWGKVVKKKPEAKLAVIGKGPERISQEFKSKIKKRGLENNIILLGFKEGPEKIKILKQSKVFLFPSTYESWGQVAGEAMAAGLPVVAYNLPHYQTIFGQAMLKAEFGDKDQFAAYVLRLLGDKKFWRQTKEQGIKQIGRYDRKVVARELLDTLDEV